MRRRIPQAAKRPPAGQSLVEFAFMATFLLIVLMGVLDLGRAYYTLLALKDAAGEGAYYAQANPKRWCATATGPCAGRDSSFLRADPDNIEYRVRNSSPSGGLVSWPNATVTITPPATIKAGEIITVTVSYGYRLLTPFLGTVAGTQTLTLTATSVSVIVTPP